MSQWIRDFLTIDITLLAASGSVVFPGRFGAKKMADATPKRNDV
jgi:hypothetical protein